jgi:hypothetical protein
MGRSVPASQNAFSHDVRYRSRNSAAYVRYTTQVLHVPCSRHWIFTVAMQCIFRLPVTVTCWVAVCRSNAGKRRTWA